MAVAVRASCKQTDVNTCASTRPEANTHTIEQTGWTHIAYNKRYFPTRACVLACVSSFLIGSNWLTFHRSLHSTWQRRRKCSPSARRRPAPATRRCCLVTGPRCDTRPMLGDLAIRGRNTTSQMAPETRATYNISSHIHHIYITYTPHIHHIYTTYTPHTHHIYITYISHIHHIYITYTSPIYHLYTT